MWELHRSESLEACGVEIWLLIRVRTVPPCGASQPLSTPVQAPWLLHVSLRTSSSPSHSKLLWTGGIPSLRVLCVHTHFKQLSLDPELSSDPKANMTFDNLPLRSPHYFRTMMYLEVSACPCVCSHSDTLLSALSWVSLLGFYSFWRGDVDIVCSSETGAINLFHPLFEGSRARRCDTRLLAHKRVCLFAFWTDLVLCLMWLILCSWPLLRVAASVESDAVVLQSRLIYGRPLTPHTPWSLTAQILCPSDLKLSWLTRSW